MATRDSFLLRIDPTVMASVRAWAADDLRSVNGQMEYLLRKALKEAGRLKKPTVPQSNPPTKGSKKK